MSETKDIAERWRVAALLGEPKFTFEQACADVEVLLELANSAVRERDAATREAKSVRNAYQFASAEAEANVRQIFDKHRPVT